MSNSKDALDKLIDGILLAIDKMINKAKFDKTVRGRITDVLPRNKYKVSIDGQIYTVKSKSQHTVQDIVNVMIPQNNIKEMFIIADGFIKDGTPDIPLYIHPNTHSLDMITETTDKKIMTSDERDKLANIEASAEVNNISDANAIDLTDKGDTTLHYHSVDRDRANHTGEQESSTISNFAPSVRSTTLTGLSTITNAVISATDNVLSALGKLQKQISDNLVTLTNHLNNKSNPHTVTKNQIGLDQVDNTSDINKPISSATQTALDGKSDNHSHNYLPLSGGSVTGDINMTSIAGVKGSVPVNTTLYTDTTQVIQSPIAKYLWHDLFAFGHKVKPTYETSSNNIDWVSSTVDMNLFAQKDSYVKKILNGSITTGARWTWNSGSFSYSSGTWLVIGVSYTSPSPTKTVLFETSADGLTWTTRHISSSSRNSTPFWHYVSGFSGDKFLRLTITKEPTDLGSVNLSTIKLLSARWGDQGGGSEYEYPYSWDGNKNITMTGNLTVPQVNGNASTATKLQTSRTISLGGDLTGCVSFDGSSNITINATVSDDSHNHIISNVDGLQGELNNKAPLASPSLTGVPIAPTASSGTNTTQIATTAFVQSAMGNAGLGDMLKTTYDKNGNGIVDRAEKADLLELTDDVSSVKYKLVMSNGSLYYEEI